MTEDAEAAVKRALNIIQAWNAIWKITINVGKFEFYGFKPWSNHFQWILAINLARKLLKHNPKPRLLGIILNRMLTFKANAKKLKEDLQHLLPTLGSVAHSNWGWRKDNLQAIFFSMVKSRLDYSASTWQLNISNDLMKDLKRIQNKALRIVPSQLQSTLTEALYIEACIPSYRSTSRPLIARSYEKTLQSAEDHPKLLALQDYIPKRTKRISWKTAVTEIAETLPPKLTNRLLFNTFAVAPWLSSKDSDWSVTAHVPGINSRHDPADAKLEAGLRQIASYDADVTIYIDGSAFAGLSDWVAAAILTEGPPEELLVIEPLQRLGLRIQVIIRRRIRRT